MPDVSLHDTVLRRHLYLVAGYALTGKFAKAAAE